MRDIDLEFDWLRDVVVAAYTMGVGSAWVVSELAKRGFAIVPASAVPTDEQRAAVGRIAHYLTIQGDYWGSCHDIETARAVAEGGK